MNTRPRSRLLLDHKAPLTAFVVVALSSVGMVVGMARSDIGSAVPRAGDGTSVPGGVAGSGATPASDASASVGSSGTANPFAAPWQPLAFTWAGAVGNGPGAAGASSTAGAAWVLRGILVSGPDGARVVTVRPPFVLVPPGTGGEVRSARSQAPGEGDGTGPAGAPSAAATDTPSPSGSPEPPAPSASPGPPAASPSPEAPAPSPSPTEPATPASPSASALPDWLQVSPAPASPSPSPEKPVASDGTGDGAASPSAAPSGGS